MDTSFFLAKLLGFYFLIYGILSLWGRKEFAALAREMGASKGLLAVSGEISLLFGLVIAIDHTMWEVSWRGLITLLGYLLILKGIIRFAFPGYVKKCIAKSTPWLPLISLILIVLGAYLTYCGFYQEG
jgi:uncharacterized membrane protein HdeD (DUF308 family)